MTAIPVIDDEAINNLRALGSEDDDAFHKEIVALFLEDTPKRFDELRTSHAAADVVKFARAAHSVKGSASNLGAMRVRAVAEKLEYAAKQNGLAGLEAMTTELEAVFADKKDDGILQNAVVARKQRGQLEPQWTIARPGGAITHW